MDTTYIIMDRLPKFIDNAATTSEDIEVISKASTKLREIGSVVCPSEFNKVVTEQFWELI